MKVGDPNPLDACDLSTIGDVAAMKNIKSESAFAPYGVVTTEADLEKRIVESQIKKSLSKPLIVEQSATVKKDSKIAHKVELKRERKPREDRSKTKDRSRSKVSLK